MGAFSVSAQTYPITVGGGGACQTTGQVNLVDTGSSGAKGSNSVFSTITSAGGGLGGPGKGSGPYGIGGNGGWRWWRWYKQSSKWFRKYSVSHCIGT